MSVGNARRLRSRPTEAETRLWSRLRQCQIEGCKFRRQAPIGPYVVDFVSHSHRLIIEVDGGQHSWRANKDKKRDTWLRQQRYSVLRFWNSEVLTNTNGVVARIYEVVNKRYAAKS